MSESIRLIHSNSAFDGGESLIERLDRLSHQESDGAVFYQQVVSSIRTELGALGVGLAVKTGVEPECQFVLASDGAEIDAPEEKPQAQGSLIQTEWAGHQLLHAKHRLDAASFLWLSIEFDRSLTNPATEVASDFAEAVVQITSAYYLRGEWIRLRQQLREATDRESKWLAVHEGVDLHRSFQAIATLTAEETDADRVFILQCLGDVAKLFASSAHPNVDRRADQVRLLERLVSSVVNEHEFFSFVVGAGEKNDRAIGPHIQSFLDDYLIASGARRIQIRRVADRHQNPIAAVCVEEFRLSDCEEHFGAISDRVAESIRLAHHREQASLSRIGLLPTLGRYANLMSSRKGLASGLLAAVFITIGLIPTRFSLPVDGRIVAKNRRFVFAPQDSRIAEVAITNGQRVESGDVLLRLHSSKLELLQGQIEGELATTNAQLMASQASRPGRETFASPKSTDASSHDNVLRARVTALQKQLQIALDQKEELTLRSPITGVVHRWNLEKEMTGKPVRHGERLVEVVDSDAGWQVEFDIPSHEIGYVLKQQAVSPCDCNVRLLCLPDKTFQSHLETISDAASLSDMNESIVLATCNLDQVRDASVVSGASVRAWVDCGDRSLGFVVFRGVIQWARRNGWL